MLNRAALYVFQRSRVLGSTRLFAHSSVTTSKRVTGKWTLTLGSQQIGLSLHTSVPLYDNNSNSPPVPPSSSSQQQPDWKKLTNEEWAERLSPESYFCAREHGTEPPFSGQYVNHKAEGVYKCVCCGSDLFTSKTKYDSGSGWPSFNAPAEEERVIRRKDISHGMVRIEVLCANCNSHLGHVFEDGPEPTRERFCINSVCLKFAPKKIG